MRNLRPGEEKWFSCCHLPAVGHGSDKGSLPGSHHLCVFVGMDSNEKKDGELNSIAVSLYPPKQNTCQA